MKTRAFALLGMCVGSLLCLIGLSCTEPPTSTVDVPNTSDPATQPASDSITASNYNISMVDPLYESTAGSRAVALGDIDGDGNLDMVSVSKESQRVQIHLQKGSTGKFDTISIAGGAPITDPIAVKLADLNNDGKLDIIVLTAHTGFAPADGSDKAKGALIMLFQGNDPRNPAEWYQIPSVGTPPPANLSLPGGDGIKDGPSALMVGPINSNNMDIAVACSEGDKSWVYLFSNPGNVFAKVADLWQPVAIEYDIQPFAHAELADIDGDGDLDIVMSVPSSMSFNLRWLENPRIDSSGTGSAGVTYAPDPFGALFEPTARAKAIVLGDFNGDGQMDAVSIGDDYQPVQLHLRQPAGNFKTVNLFSGPPLKSIADVAVADVNGDGLLDIVFLVADTGLVPGAKQSALVMMIQGSDPSNPLTWTMIPGPIGSFPRNLLFGNKIEAGSLVVKDVDGIPGVDILVSVQGAVRLFPNPGQAKAMNPTAWVSTVIESTTTASAKLDVADVDGDGDSDVVIADHNADGFNVRWLQNPAIQLPGTTSTIIPTFLSDQVRPDLVDPLFEATAGAKAVAIGDINGDGELDVVSIHDESQAVQLHLRDPITKKFTTYTISGGAPMARVNVVRLADFNNDGKLDIAVLANDSGFIPPTGWNITKFGALILLIQGNDPTKPADWTRVDMTTDPRHIPPLPPSLDLLPFYEDSPFCFWNNLAGVTDMVVGDFTGDGLPDIVVASNEAPEMPPHSSVWLIPNPGAANVKNHSAWTREKIEQEGVPDYGQLAAVDIDNNGILDIVVTVPTAIADNVRWLQNNGDGTWTRRLVGHQEGGGNILSIGDIDQDGLLDVAVGSSELRLVQWFKNPGPAVLANGVRSPWYVFNIGELLNVTGVLEQIHLVDLNNDGTLDCFVSVHDASKGFGWIAGFQSQGDIYDTWEKFPIDSNEGRYGTVAFADFDSNGRLDFLAPLDLPGVMYDRIAFYSSIVDDRWRRNVIGCQENGADYMAVGDIDNDGQPDVAVGSAALGLVQWFRNPGTTSLIASQGQMPWKLSAIGAVGSDKMSNLQLVDLTGSGKLDCVATAGGAILAFWQGTNPQAEWQASLIEQLDNATIGRLAFAALNNNNGMLDFIAPIIRGNARDDRIAVYTLVARNQWQRRLIGQQPGNAGTISVGDIDGDGHPDIACSTGNLTQWFRNPGSQRLHNATIQVPWDVFNIGTVDADTVNQVRLVDLDSNGTLQCLVTGSGKAWGFKRGSNVTNYWQSFPLFITDPIAEVGTLGFGDFNKDGKLDFVVPISRNDSLDTLIKDHFFLFLRK